MYNPVQIIHIPDDANLYIVGDIHGCYTQLINELSLLSFDPERDYLISVGDIVDRGKESREAVNLLDNDWFKAVEGNHENFCVLGFANRNIENSHCDYRNGGSWFYKLPKEEQAVIVEKFKKLPILLEVHYRGKKYGVVHADVPIHDWEVLKHAVQNRFYLDDRLISDYCLWSRDLVYQTTAHIKNVDRVFLGHTVLPNVRHVGNCTFLDTGAVFASSDPEMPPYKLTIWKVE